MFAFDIGAQIKRQGEEMFLILEIAMLIGGVVAITTAKVPSFLVGGGNIQVEGLAARLLGGLLILPIPIAFLGGFFLPLLLGERGTRYAFFLEVGAEIGVPILAGVLMRIVGQKVEPANDIEAKIIIKAQGAFMYAIFSATGFAALICCPLAFVYANQALKLIDEHGVGEQHRRVASRARVIAGIATSLWAIAVICLVSASF